MFMHSTLVNLQCEVTLCPFFIQSVSWSVRVCCRSRFQGHFLNFRMGEGLLLREGSMGKNTQIMALYKVTVFIQRNKHKIFRLDCSIHTCDMGPWSFVNVSYCYVCFDSSCDGCRFVSLWGCSVCLLL